MNISTTNKILGLLLGILIIMGIYQYMHTKSVSVTRDTYTFMCDNNKSIIATFYQSDDKGVDLKLSDGRMLTVPHAMSGSGARYANADESFVFWNKGITAFITEGKDGATTYANCSTDHGQNTDNPEATSTSSTTPIKTPTTTPTTGGIKSNLATYTNGEYKFEINFPKNLSAQNGFSPFYQLSNNWRLNASLVNQGKAIVSIPVFRIDQGSVATGKNYPLFYIAEVRVGVSPNVKECYAVDAGYSNQKVNSVTIGGIAFKQFSFSDADMMKYVRGESYRTIYNNQCYVIEQIEHGSSYRDETMKPGISDAALKGYYDQAGVIAKSFSFIK